MALQNKFLFFQDGNNDAYCYPLDRFIGFRHAADTTLLMEFKPLTDDSDSVDTATLTIVSGKEFEAINDIVNLINGAPHAEGLITIADNVRQTYASVHVTDIAGTLDA